jgi:Tfp pilus assembly protein PilX
MTSHPLNLSRSEKGVALIMVLLLLGVVAALTTGLSLSGQTEVAMAQNEQYYAGARGAAEAGLNRAVARIVADTSTNLLAGADGAWDAGNAAAAVNADNGLVPGLNAGTYSLNSQYSYSLRILDDDDPSLYQTALTNAQLTQMGEDGNGITNQNQRLILRATGTGPHDTVVTISRILQSVATQNVNTTTTNVLTNPAILVDGDLSINGSIEVFGSQGNVHANGNITGNLSSSGQISGNATATGTIDAGVQADGLTAGNMAPVTVPEVKAADYFSLSDWVLTSSGTILRADDSVQCGTKTGPTCPTGWTWDGTSWSASGAMPQSATYYAQTDVSVHGTGTSTNTALSIITEGSLKITGNGKFSPENNAKIQFVTNGDFELGGTVDADDSVNLDGQIMVREQMKIYGNSEFQGRVMVDNVDSANNAYDASTNPNGRKGTSSLTANDLSGNMRVQYNGSLGSIVSTVVTTTAGPTTYANNISGWIEQ